MDLSKAIKVIGLAALIAGAVDFFYPSTLVLMSGGSVVALWQYVASGLLGREAFSLGMAGAVYGVIFHFLIIFVFGAVVYLLYRKMPVIREHPVLSGLVYGSYIWFVMNLLVVPLSKAGNYPVQITVDAMFILGFVVHLIVGLLLVLMIKRASQA